MTSPDEPERLRQSLQRLSTRSAQALSLRLLDALSREDCARFFGITLAAFDVLLLRAARELAGMPPLPRFELEREEAGALAAGLKSPQPGGELAELLSPLRALATHAAAVKARIAEAERADERSPSRLRETWARRALVAIIIALTLYFYWSAE